MRLFIATAALVGSAALMVVLIACSRTQPSPTAPVTTTPVAATPPAGPPRPVAAAEGGDSTAVDVERADRIRFMYADIYFKNGSAALDDSARRLLDEKAVWLREHPDARVIIEGHTDERGSREYNLAFGERRAGAVKSYLMQQGIEGERLEAVSYGRERPAVPGRSADDRAKNRRVHLVIED